MKIDYRVYLLKDSQGNTTYNVCEEGADFIQVCGMKNKNNERVYFESEAYHLDSFCKCNDIELKVFELKHDFDTLWNSNNTPTN